MPDERKQNFSLRIPSYVIDFYRRLGIDQGRGYQGIMSCVLQQFADRKIAEEETNAE